MGNKIGRRKQAVDEKFTRPQGLYHLQDIDYKKLRKLILDAKLAPCYPGDDDDCSLDLEECPICFLHYPSLNRSKCCTKGICTECFLQMKPSQSTRPAQCPFCKTSNYAVEYRGAKTKEEKGVEQVEEQRVIEAQIRMRQQELQDENDKVHTKDETSSSVRSAPLAEVEYEDVSSSSYSAPCFRYSSQDDEAVSSHVSCSLPLSAHSLYTRQNRDSLDMDLEDIMIMEAIWLSIQEQGMQTSPSSSRTNVGNLPEHGLFTEDCFNSHGNFPAESSSSSGPACTMAAQPEPQHIADASTISVGGCLPVSRMMQCSANFPPEEGRVMVNYTAENWTDDLQGDRRLLLSEDQWISDITTDAQLVSPATPARIGFDSSHVTPENLEDQMMLTMAVSMAEARGLSPQGITWM
ncbi:hypothetical protein AXF42_Ash007191 [Apostasia shenzhenica]|uniref:RING-type domain-containing protein n=1 Tax=Apostasia shenzhenica TaxID=1088818 RepID=A0A2I0B9I7_9ASPA|nr:hypothetical protein AXF42_Ash007191 [Apostasia shenzhenica]